MNLIEVFSLGMDRTLGDVWPFPEYGPVLNLGAGKKKIPNTTPLDADSGWTAPGLNFADESVAGAYAFHFMEHLSKDEVIGLLRELERVFKPGGSLICVTPLAGSEMSFQDLDHKSFWAEGTWKNLFSNPYYDGTMPRDWRFTIHLNVIMGVAQRNLALVSQIVKVVS